MSKLVTVTVVFNVDDSVELDTLRGDISDVVENAMNSGSLFADNDAGVRDFIVRPLVIKQLIEQD